MICKELMPPPAGPTGPTGPVFKPVVIVTANDPLMNVVTSAQMSVKPFVLMLVVPAVVVVEFVVHDPPPLFERRIVSVPENVPAKLTVVVAAFDGSCCHKKLPVVEHVPAS
jgi:hypothetical protein